MIDSAINSKPEHSFIDQETFDFRNTYRPAFYALYQAFAATTASEVVQGISIPVALLSSFLLYVLLLFGGFYLQLTSKNQLHAVAHVMRQWDCSLLHIWDHLASPPGLTQVFITRLLADQIITAVSWDSQALWRLRRVVGTETNS